MKVILVNNSKGSSGGEEYLLDLAQRIGAYGFEPIFFIHEEGMLNRKVRDAGYRFHQVFSRKWWKIPFLSARAIREEKPEIILVAREHNLYPVAAGYLLAAPLLTRKPRLISVFQTPTGRPYPLLTNLYDGIIATSEYTAQSFFPKNPGMERKTRIIHYGISLPPLEPDKFTIDRPRRVLKGRPFPLIGMVGELWKNQSELVDAGVQLCTAFPDITIAIVGGGDMEPLQRRIALLGLENNIILTGRIPREQIPDLFYDLDLSVSTHRNEGFGIVHIESLAARTPVVAYNSGGLVEIIRKGGGVLVDGGVDDFCRAVVVLLEDHQRRFALGEEGRRVVQEFFALETMAERHAAFFHHLLSQGFAR